MRIHITALLAVAALSLTACGAEEEDPAAATGQPDQSTRQAMADFAECMRKEGIDFPDPGQGGFRLKGDPDEIGAAEEACKELREKIEPPELSDEQEAEFKDAALAHARCMREEGIDFPDPEFSGDGGARINLGKSGIDPDDADFKAAQEKCEDELPEPSIEGEDAP